MSIAGLRKEYSQTSLTEAAVHPDPITQFRSWFDEALKAKIAEPNVMTVATVDADRRPSARILLLKDVDERGFTWFTNYQSRKASELAQSPHAALVFYWGELERQVRIEGRVERVSSEESETYFHSRPLQSRLGALASAQSQPIADRQALEERFRQANEQYGDQPPRPEHWGGYRLIPERIEFWQGRPSRLHDRILYTKQQNGGWQRQRLQP
jgi:pyridoxamine 5'-phosphate oxidase